MDRDLKEYLAELGDSIDRHSIGYAPVIDDSTCTVLRSLAEYDEEIKECFNALLVNNVYVYGDDDLTSIIESITELKEELSKLYVNYAELLDICTSTLSIFK